MLITNYGKLREALDEQCRLLGRDPAAVTLVAVSKTVGIESVESAVSEGARVFGENRPDSLLEKQRAHPELQWHFIGNIQSRRIRDIVAASDLIHSVCKPTHLPKIDERAREIGKVQRILLEVNVSGEETKSGFKPAELPRVLEACDAYDALRVEGLMTMAPQGDLEEARRCFDALAQLRDRCSSLEFPRHGRVELHELSMGMSEDWKQAVACGATMIRIGRAIFSEDFES